MTGMPILERSPQSSGKARESKVAWRRPEAKSIMKIAVCVGGPIESHYRIRAAPFP
jgi:hypothetical protein